MKVAVVVQRYGADINGGAELHARYVAEHLARHVEVEVLTTCAHDYITWANALPAGEEQVHGITVRRFPVSHPRDPQEFGSWSRRVFEAPHSVNDELAWLDAEGPASPALIQFIAREQGQYDWFLFFSLRYYHAYHGVRTVPHKAILVPTAERDEALGLGLFPAILRAARGIMYNSLEERAYLQAMAGTDAVPGVVVGIGSEVPARGNPERFRDRFGLRDRFAIYVGRIDENKGCKELFDFWARYSESPGGSLHLVLIGHPVLPIPRHPRIHHLGFVSDEEKFDAIAAADLLVMPSYFESLSMVALEAWALGRPVLANGRCDVLRGQAIRSNAGLYYESFAEFREALRAIEQNPGLAATLGCNGRDFYRRHYAWPVIEQKYLEMFERLGREGATSTRTLEPLPGWWGRRQRRLPPAREVLAQLPSGPVKATATGDGGPLRRLGRAIPVSKARHGDRAATHERPADARPAGHARRDGEPRRNGDGRRDVRDARGGRRAGPRRGRPEGGRPPGASPRPAGDTRPPTQGGQGTATKEPRPASRRRRRPRGRGPGGGPGSTGNGSAS